MVDFKEPAVAARLSGIKKLNSGADHNPQPSAVANGCASCRDKIEFQFAVPKVENHPERFRGRFRRDYENSPPRRSVNREERFLWENVSRLRQRDATLQLFEPDGDRRTRSIGIADPRSLPKVAMRGDRLAGEHDLAIAPISTSYSLGGMNRPGRAQRRSIAPGEFRTRHRAACAVDQSWCRWEARGFFAA